MKVARLMSVEELAKFDRGEEIVSYGKYFGKTRLNNMADICSTPYVTFFDPNNDGSCWVVSRMWDDGNMDLQLIVLFEMDDHFIRGCSEGKYEELYIRCYSKDTAYKLWQSESFIKDSCSELEAALTAVRGGRKLNFSGSDTYTEIMYKTEAVKMAWQSLYYWVYPSPYVDFTEAGWNEGAERAETMLEFLRKTPAEVFARDVITSYLKLL